MAITSPLDAKRERVKRVFEEPQRYLRQYATIEVRAKASMELLAGQRPSRIADIGCGDARCSIQFLREDTTLTLVDYAAGMLEAARERVPPALLSNVTFVNQPLGNFRPSAPFDLVLALGLLAHVPSLEEALQQLFQLLRPGGRCLLQLTDADAWAARAVRRLSQVRNQVAQRESLEVTRTTEEDLLRRAREVGFESVASRSYWVPVPGMGVLPPRLVAGIMTTLYSVRPNAKAGSEKLLLLKRPE